MPCRPGSSWKVHLVEEAPEATWKPREEGGLQNEDVKSGVVVGEAEPGVCLDTEERVRKVSNFQDVFKYSGLRLFL